VTIILNDTNPPFEEALQHFGTKGMKWGVRRQKRKEQNRQIKDARRKIAGKEAEIDSLVRQANKTKSATERARLDKLANKKAIALFNNPDHITASRMTSGEKWANGLLLAGAVGLAGAAAAAKTL